MTAREDLIGALGPGAGERIDPRRSAQQHMLRPLPKRFYKLASVGEAPGGFSLLLDGRPARTPGGPIQGIDKPVFPHARLPVLPQLHLAVPPDAVLADDLHRQVRGPGDVFPGPSRPMSEHHKRRSRTRIENATFRSPPAF